MRKSVIESVKSAMKTKCCDGCEFNEVKGNKSMTYTCKFRVKISNRFDAFLKEDGTNEKSKEKRRRSPKGEDVEVKNESYDASFVSKNQSNPTSEQLSTSEPFVKVKMRKCNSKKLTNEQKSGKDTGIYDDTLKRFETPNPFNLLQDIDDYCVEGIRLKIRIKTKNPKSFC